MVRQHLLGIRGREHRHHAFGIGTIPARWRDHLAGPYRLGAGFRQYHIAPDGRFLMQRRAGQGSADRGEARQITVVLNWFEELRERVPN